MRVIGLAGRAGSGKTAIGRTLAQGAGVAFVDLDRVAWDTYRPHAQTYWRLVSRFGRGILRPDGAIDRTRLAEATFKTEKNREDLNAIVHPAVIDSLKETIREETARGTRLLFVEGALLGSSPHVDRSLFTRILWLEVSDETREKRLAACGRAVHAERAFAEPTCDAVIGVNADGTVQQVADRILRLVETL
jgi:dephospho-CoA kinase